MERKRHLYIIAILFAVALGLASRRFGALLPAFIESYAGDTLWALTVFLGIACIFPRASTLNIAAAALLLSFAVEVSQLYHAPWIDSLRQSTLGGLTLGYGFLWSDLVCYTAGVVLGVGLDRKLR